jgi:hypothetical protein
MNGMVHKGSEIWAGFINSLLELLVSPSVCLNKRFLAFAKGGCLEFGAKLVNPSQDLDRGISLGRWGDFAEPDFTFME